MGIIINGSKTLTNVETLYIANDFTKPNGDEIIQSHKYHFIMLTEIFLYNIKTTLMDLSIIALMR